MGGQRGRLISGPNRLGAVELIHEACTAGARLAPACAVLEISVRTYQRWRKPDGAQDGRRNANRPRPANRLSDEERREILNVCNQPAFSHLPPAQIVPKLVDEGRYIASESTFYRVLKDADQLNHRGRARASRQSTPPASHVASGPNQVWSWDITFLRSCVTGLFFRLYLVLDIYSRKIVAWEIHEEERSEHAALLIQKACLAEAVLEHQLVLHSDNGAPMKGVTMLVTLQKLGIIPSFSRPSVSDDNPYSESLFRTLKYTPTFPSQPFVSIEAARKWVLAFVQWYNEVHQHSGIQFVTPGQRHRGEHHAILAQRQIVYEAAKNKNPERWSGSTRNWAPTQEVALNPIRIPQPQSSVIHNVA